MSFRVRKEPGRFRTSLAALFTAAAVCACSSGSASPFISSPHISLAGGQPSPVGIGGTGSFTVAESSYTGLYTFTISDASIASLSVPSGSSVANTRVTYAASQSVSDRSGIVQYTCKSNGTATITVATTDSQLTVEITCTAGSPVPSPTSSASPTSHPTSSPSPSPTVSPTVSPVASATPSAGIVVSPSTLTLAGIGASNAQQSVVSESGYAGTFAESDTCSGIATVASISGTNPLTVGVTGIAAGSCSAHFTDSFSQTATLTISVTTAGVIIQTHKGL